MVRAVLWIQLLISVFATELPSAVGQVAAVDDPIAAAQVTAARRAAPPSGAGANAINFVAVITDPIEAAQVLAVAERAFPNLATDLENAELLRRAANDPSIRGSLRGRIAEEDWINRNAKDGWRPVRSSNAPQNDAFRFVNGQPEGAQVKVHADWHEYIKSMRADNKAERFVLPDDHFDLVYRELETRRFGAVRGGLAEKAAEYARQQQRLTRMGRTFTELDGAIGSTAKHYGRIARAIRAGGKAASYVGVALALLDGGIAVYEVATGKEEVEELVARLSKVAVGGAAAWAVGKAAAGATVAAGATGAIPVAVAIVLATVTYLVVDWAIDTVTNSIRVGSVTPEDLKRLWPEGARGVPLDRLYQKPPDAASVLK